MNDAIDGTRNSSTGWFVVWTESRAEKKVASRIEAQGMEAWMPTVTERHRWSDRWRNVVLPLFPGYLFARVKKDAGVTGVLRTPGVLTVVKCGSKPAIVPDDFISRLRVAIESAGNGAMPVTEPHYYEVNDEIVVQDGPLAGLRGVVRQLRGAKHLLVWVHEIGRGVAFTISAELVSHRSHSRVASSLQTNP